MSSDINNYLILERQYRMIKRSINDWSKYPQEQELLQKMNVAWNSLTDEEIKFLENEALFSGTSQKRI